MILERLREYTAAQHSAMERKWPVLQPQFSLAAYRGLLRRLYGFYEPLERQLVHRRWEPAAFDYAVRLKTPWLAEDLAALGDDAQALQALPRCGTLPPVQGWAEVLGSLYVIEGATLGGQIISRHLAARFGLQPHTGAAFFHSYGPATGPRWQEFGAFLVQASAGTGADGTEILTSARRTFQSLEEWLFPNP